MYACEYMSFKSLEACTEVVNTPMTVSSFLFCLSGSHDIVSNVMLMSVGVCSVLRACFRRTGGHP